MPKEYDAAKHAGKVCHEAPVLMSLIFFFFPFYIFYFKKKEPTPSQTRPAHSATAAKLLWRAPATSTNQQPGYQLKFS